MSKKNKIRRLSLAEAEQCVVVAGPDGGAGTAAATLWVVDEDGELDSILGEAYGRGPRNRSYRGAHPSVGDWEAWAARKLAGYGLPWSKAHGHAEGAGDRWSAHDGARFRFV